MRESLESGIIFIVGMPFIAMGCAEIAAQHTRVLGSRITAGLYNSTVGKMNGSRYIPARLGRHEGGSYVGSDDPDFYLVPGMVRKRDIKPS